MTGRVDPTLEAPREDPLREDHHVHSTFSDDATSTVAENLTAAGARGLRTVCLTDHVRADTTWVPELLATVRAASAPDGLRVRCGVEAKMLDATGRMDLPERLPELDRVLIADHQFPGAAGPTSPAAVRRGLARGDLSPAQVVETLVVATTRALARTPVPQLAHLFSLLPKVGLAEEQVGPDQLAALADAARTTGAVVEVNEKWHCPGPAALAAFRAAGVPVVASTDSHRAADVGRYRRVRRLLAAAGP